ncbi:MAG: 2-isopropylmalate synthase [Phycisphaerae bacterium]|jgi:2-isopropylmalate synthase
MPDKQAPKYGRVAAIDLPDRQWPSRTIQQSPQWCSVDLRDGNQALPNPLTPAQKLEYFRLLCDIGIKNIEVAFPSASQDDFDFTRRLIEENEIPRDVMIMGLSQCREHLISRTFESMAGIPRGIVHLYCATSELHMRQVFGLSRKQTLDLVVKSIAQTRDLAAGMPHSDIRLEFSPEEFTDSDPDFVVEVCRAVFETWGKATAEKPLIFNLPATVERRPPNQYADMIEYFCRHFAPMDKILVSLHSHNDQGMAVAATEMALLAGAHRVEGTLFGHGERTGNVDLVVMAGNLRSRGIETGLDFSDLPRIARTVERLTGMPVYYRQPYAGEYVFTAFSGSHQDAIRKGLLKLKEAPEKFGVQWKVPYLHVDPADVGRKYERLIRINAQSGKGGVAWVLEQDYGLKTPKAMHPEIGEAVQKFSDKVARELMAGEVHQVFRDEFVRPAGPYELVGYWPRPDENDPTQIHGELKIRVNGEEKTVSADGNGPISAFMHAMKTLGVSGYGIEDYDEQALGKGAEAVAVAYVPLKMDSGQTLYGVGIDTNIDQAAVRAIVAALNRMSRKKSGGKKAK